MGADRELGRRLTAAIAYLLRLQASSGAWTDFWLPVGTSDAWATAFVGLGMHAASGSPVLDPQVRQEALSAAQRAAAWLLAQPRPHGGWGYNSQVAPDADSTAHSLSLLARLGLPAPAEAIAFLLSCRTWSDVGCCTRWLPHLHLLRPGEPVGAATRRRNRCRAQGVVRSGAPLPC